MNGTKPVPLDYSRMSRPLRLWPVLFLILAGLLAYVAKEAVHHHRHPGINRDVLIQVEDADTEAVMLFSIALNTDNKPNLFQSLYGIGNAWGVRWIDNDDLQVRIYAGGYAPQTLTLNRRSPAMLVVLMRKVGTTRPP